jgi:toxin ParE1/3/4
MNCTARVSSLIQMSVPDYRLEIAENAQRDIVGIRIYSREQWGDREADDYLGRITRSFDSLQLNPELGRPADHVSDDLRQLLVGKHRILYRLHGETVRIVRVVHMAMDLTTVKRL